MSGDEFFKSQSYTGLAYDDETEEMVGLYILHPNNVGRYGHISNTSYAVKSGCRGKRVGEKLVLDCISKGKELGFNDWALRNWALYQATSVCQTDDMRTSYPNIVYFDASTLLNSDS